MLNKKQARENLRSCRKDFGNQITELRKRKSLTIEGLSHETGERINYIEKLELGMLDINIGNLNCLARFFNKKIRIELVD